MVLRNRFLARRFFRQRRLEGGTHDTDSAVEVHQLLLVFKEAARTLTSFTSLPQILKLVDANSKRCRTERSVAALCLETE